MSGNFKWKLIQHIGNAKRELLKNKGIHSCFQLQARRKCKASSVFLATKLSKILFFGCVKQIISINFSFICLNIITRSKGS